MLKSFNYAIRGIKDALKTEPNLRFHFLFSIIIIATAVYLKLNSVELSVLVITIFFVICLELANTIIEKVVDQHSKTITEEARIIKDISAGMVLLGAIASIIIGLILILPKLF